MVVCPKCKKEVESLMYCCCEIGTHGECFDCYEHNKNKILKNKFNYAFEWLRQYWNFGQAQEINNQSVDGVTDHYSLNSISPSNYSSSSVSGPCNLAECRLPMPHLHYEI